MKLPKTDKVGRLSAIVAGAGLVGALVYRKTRRALERKEEKHDKDSEPADDSKGIEWFRKNQLHMRRVENRHRRMSPGWNYFDQEDALFHWHHFNRGARVRHLGGRGGGGGGGNQKHGTPTPFLDIPKGGEGTPEESARNSNSPFLDIPRNGTSGSADRGGNLEEGGPNSKPNSSLDIPRSGGSAPNSNLKYFSNVSPDDLGPEAAGKRDKVMSASDWEEEKDSGELFPRYKQDPSGQGLEGVGPEDHGQRATSPNYYDRLLLPPTSGNLAAEEADTQSETQDEEEKERTTVTIRSSLFDSEHAPEGEGETYQVQARSKNEDTGSGKETEDSEAKHNSHDDNQGLPSESGSDCFPSAPSPREDEIGLRPEKTEPRTTPTATPSAVSSRGNPCPDPQLRLTVLASRGNGAGSDGQKPEPEQYNVDVCESFVRGDDVGQVAKLNVSNGGDLGDLLKIAQEAGAIDVGLLLHIVKKSALSGAGAKIQDDDDIKLARSDRDDGGDDDDGDATDVMGSLHYCRTCIRQQLLTGREDTGTTDHFCRTCRKRVTVV